MKLFYGGELVLRFERYVTLANSSSINSAKVNLCVSRLPTSPE
jgi:hypothetical protein